MDTAEKIYEYIINNEIIEKDYFDDYSSNNSLEFLFHTFINDSVLADSVKIKMLKKGQKKTIYEHFNLVQTKFNELMYGIKNLKV